MTATRGLEGAAAGAARAAWPTIRAPTSAVVQRPGGSGIARAKARNWSWSADGAGGQTRRSNWLCRPRRVTVLSTKSATTRPSAYTSPNVRADVSPRQPISKRAVIGPGYRTLTCVSSPAGRPTTTSGSTPKRASMMSNRCRNSR